MQVNQAGARLIFDNAARLMRNAGYTIDDTKLTQSEIRTEVAMSTSANSLILPITANNANGQTIFNTMKLLNQSDVAVVTAMGLFVAKPSSSSDLTYEAFPYPNLTTFSTAGSAAAIRGAYNNGNLAVTVDQQQVVPYWSLRKHYKAPMTQQAANVDYTASSISLLDSLDNCEDGYYPIEPNWVWSGNSTIQAQLNNVVTGTIETNARWVAIFRIILAQNASATANR